MCTSTFFKASTWGGKATGETTGRTEVIKCGKSTMCTSALKLLVLLWAAYVVQKKYPFLMSILPRYASIHSQDSNYIQHSSAFPYTISSQSLPYDSWPIRGPTSVATSRANRGRPIGRTADGRPDRASSRLFAKKTFNFREIAPVVQPPLSEHLARRPSTFAE
jgi:hypothetical protein